MDFWDLTQLLVRRWRIALPMLLLTLVLVVLTLTRVKPNYVETAYVELVPPVPIVVDGVTQPDQRNPWMSQGLTTLGNAALITIHDLPYVQGLKDAGYTDKFDTMIGGSIPMVTITVTAASQAQAVGTADQLINRFEESVGSLQTSYGVDDADLITTLRLDNGRNIALSTSRLKRYLVLVLGVGLLMTTAVTVAADAWIRRRPAWSESDEAADAADATEPGPTSEAVRDRNAVAPTPVSPATVVSTTAASATAASATGAAARVSGRVAMSSVPYAAGREPAPHERKSADVVRRDPVRDPVRDPMRDAVPQVRRDQPETPKTQSPKAQPESAAAPREPDADATMLLPRAVYAKDE